MDHHFLLPQLPLIHRLYNLCRLENLNLDEGQHSAHVYDLYEECYHEAAWDHYIEDGGLRES